MSIADDVKGDLRAAKKLRLPWWAVLFGIIASFLCAWLFDHFGKLGLVLPALNSVLVLGFMIVLKRKLWPQSWFWYTMAAIAAVHVLMVLFVPWTMTWVPGAAIAVVDSVDLCILIWILATVGKFMEGRQAT